MIGIDARDGISRLAVLALLLDAAPGLLPGDDLPVGFDAATRERVLAWARKQPSGTLALADAPLDPAFLRALPTRLDRLDVILANWVRNGMWVIGRDDPAFPKRLRRRLGAQSPELLFGQGDASLAARGGVAVVRGQAAEPQLISVLDAALADSMLGLIGLPPGTDSIRIERVSAPGVIATLRVSPPGHAPADRTALETCCYGLADTVVAVGLARTDPAWSGLVTVITQDRQPVWVHGATGDAALLVRAGAHAIPPGLLAEGADGLLLPAPSPRARNAAIASNRPSAAPVPVPLQMPRPTLVHGFAEAQAGFGTDTVPPMDRAGPPMLRLVPTTERADAATSPTVSMDTTTGATLFELFGQRLLALLAHGPLGAARIAEAMDLTRPQVDAWLLRAQAEGIVLSDGRTRLFASPDR